jgi:hypothetical protein
MERVGEIDGGERQGDRHPTTQDPSNRRPLGNFPDLQYLLLTGLLWHWPSV